MRFSDAARPELGDPRGRRVRRRAAADARARRTEAVKEAPDWELLREAGAAIRDRTLGDLGTHLEALEAAVLDEGGHVHWARDAGEARRIVHRLLPADTEAALVRSDVTDEIGLAGGEPGPHTKAAVVGAGFLVAETGTLVVADRGEGLTFPAALVVVAGLEDMVPDWADLEVLLQLLSRAGAGRPMHPAVATRTGEFELVLVDNGRTKVLADPVGREALRCVHCSACSDVCPVFERAGPRPYSPGRPGPIGAVLTPQVHGVEAPLAASLPFASTLCGACGDVCPVKIDIPGLLAHLRGRVVESRRARPVPTPELLLMRGVAWSMADQRRYERTLVRRARWARLLARDGKIRRLPGLLGKWTDARDLPAPPRQTFRAWWRAR
ncbi:4Fe-4S dicluster domain-containing protein [Actinomadura sp. DC4]|uniref:4Fe-4S dicluster domain-containing protein n=1 Tax=Actinomadura sp. DC4 TaxID=3055069 RepID=UPI0025B05C61|nr:4Fe-4S dicluster domain-containing protein [Actinomadura sp. DC4]MDN3359468.1 LUD domain-containing protein [Actinomadura sp. DC4]